MYDANKALATDGPVTRDEARQNILDAINDIALRCTASSKSDDALAYGDAAVHFAQAYAYLEFDSTDSTVFPPLGRG